jgi:hypothetical protein
MGNAIKSFAVDKVSDYTVKRFRENLLKEIYLTKFQNYKVIGLLNNYQKIVNADLFEPYAPDSKEMSIGSNITMWDADYFTYVYKNLGKNFAYYRLMYLREIALYVFGP